MPYKYAVAYTHKYRKHNDIAAKRRNNALCTLRTRTRYSRAANTPSPSVVPGAGAGATHTQTHTHSVRSTCQRRRTLDGWKIRCSCSSSSVRLVLMAVSVSARGRAASVNRFNTGPQPPRARVAAAKRNHIPETYASSPQRSATQTRRQPAFR